jgi:glutaredoxin-related protein
MCFVPPSQAANCSSDLGSVRIALETMEVTYVEADKKYNPGRCDASVRIKGSITNISNQSISHLNFSTDSRPNQGVNSGLSDLKPREIFSFDITISYSWIKCGSVTTLLVSENGAKIKKGTLLCDFPVSLLPVELVDFNFNESDRSLVWKTASEENNKGFIIEYSTDGAIWWEIGFESAAGSNSIGASYQFVLHPANFNGYYRLKQIDFDGKVEFSPIIFVEGQIIPSGDAVTLYPNPAHDFLHSTNVDIDAVDIYDLSGRFIKHLKMQDGKVPIADLQSGMYIGILLRRAEKTPMKFIKT